MQAQLNAGDSGFAGNWLLAGANLTQGHQIQANEWNGERLFQAAKFGTETRYMHMVFEEFARYVAPSIHVAGGVNVQIDPAITSEFANVVYRFGHSMLDENVNIYEVGADRKAVIGANGQPVMTQAGLIQAFTNPDLFNSKADMTADLVLGTVGQVSNSINEFVTGLLRNNLPGLPLDLAALNIARGRDTGVPPLKAYANWTDFGSQLKHPASLINFVAAYGIRPSISGQVTAAVTGTLRDRTAQERRDADGGHTIQYLGDDNFFGNTIVMGGTKGNDRLTAGAAEDDTLWGYGGNDILNDGGGADFQYGGDGNDTLIGGQGDDTLHGDAGNDTIFGGDGIDNIFGGDGNTTSRAAAATTSSSAAWATTISSATRARIS